MKRRFNTKVFSKSVEQKNEKKLPQGHLLWVVSLSSGSFALNKSGQSNQNNLTPSEERKRRDFFNTQDEPAVLSIQSPGSSSLFFFIFWDQQFHSFNQLLFLFLFQLLKEKKFMKKFIATVRRAIRIVIGTTAHWVVMCVVSLIEKWSERCVVSNSTPLYNSIQRFTITINKRFKNYHPLRDRKKEIMRITLRYHIKFNAVY